MEKSSVNFRFVDAMPNVLSTRLLLDYWGELTDLNSRFFEQDFVGTNYLNSNSAPFLAVS